MASTPNVQLQNDKLGIDVVLHELKQRHIEAFAVAIKAAFELPLAKYRGEVVRAAVTCGWIKSPEIKVNDVGEMKAGAVRWLSEKLATVYTDAMELDPKD